MSFSECFWWGLDIARDEPRPEPLRVQCARCGITGTSETFIVEEGDEWECPPCNERENARERGAP